jgi:hypothetical protein
MTCRIRRERPLFIHIEQIQDLVEETLLELGHGKVALARQASCFAKPGNAA